MLTMMSAVGKRKSYSASSSSRCTTRAAAHNGNHTLWLHQVALEVLELVSQVRLLLPPPAPRAHLDPGQVLPSNSPPMEGTFPHQRLQQYQVYPRSSTQCLRPPRSPAPPLLAPLRSPHTLKMAAFQSLPGSALFTHLSQQSRASLRLRREILLRWWTGTTRTGGGVS